MADCGNSQKDTFMYIMQVLSHAPHPHDHYLKMRSLLSFLLIAITTSCLIGCSPQTGQKHFFWKVSDSNSAVYILGSIHLADSSFYPLDPVITNAFDSSDELAVEIDMGDDSILQEITSMNEQYGMFHGEDSLERILPGDIRKSLDSICTAWNIPIGTFNRYKPWAAAMTLTSIGIMRLGYDYNLGIDFHFLHLAQEHGKNIVSLEPVENQVTALTGEGLKDSVTMYFMKKTLREIGLIDSSVTWMMRAWKTGDDTLFWNAMNADTAKLSANDSIIQKEIDNRILHSRNRTMAEFITKLLTEKRKAFVVIGTAHLVGKDENIIDILRRKGFTIERL